MPLYTYRCISPSCGYQFEVQQRMSEEPLQNCPVCAGTIRRVINNVGVVFKGNGYYITDHRKNGTSHHSSPSKSTETSSEPVSTPEKATTEKVPTEKATSSETAVT